MIQSDKDAMAHALKLAAKGVGHVEPNPAVGAVLLDCSRTVVGEGFHEKYGRPHAEVNAIAQYRKQYEKLHKKQLENSGEDADLSGATLFVTLEPCSHFGKTGPCANAILEAGISNVVIAMQDPNEKVNGKGIQILKDAGVHVEVGLMEEEARELNAPFIKCIQTGIPYIHAKWAMTLDGKLATRTQHSQWISNSDSRKIVHELRGKMDAIIAGIGTVLADDPLLTARPEGAKRAVRIVLDRHGEIPVKSQLVQTISEAPLLVITSQKMTAEKKKQLEQAGVEVWVTPENERSDLVHLMQKLRQRKMTNILIEGGAEILGSFFDSNLIDEYHTFIAPKVVAGQAALSPFGSAGLELIPKQPNVEIVEVRNIAGDIYLRSRHTPRVLREGSSDE